MIHYHLRAKHNEAPSPSIVDRQQLPATKISNQAGRLQSRSSGFTLNKFYLDAVTDTGQYFIGYAADLSFKRVSLGYADTLHSPELPGICPGPRIGYAQAPVERNGGINWDHAGLGFKGCWSPLAPSRKATLLSTRHGHVDWHCLQPAASVSLGTASGLAIEALGYCEHLSLTIPPWQLGLTELVWGRFVSTAQSVVWIVWRGRHPMCLVLWNDNSTSHADICEHNVNTDGFALAIEPVRTLRQGYLGRNILSKVPVVNKLAPAALLHIHEDKQLGHGVLRMRDGCQHEGWVIHEKVTWPH